MLSENIKAIRKTKGLSQAELAVKCNVVRQTISKWEQGLSVPDSDMLVALSEALETPVSVLLGETVTEAKADDMSVIAQKLEVINLQLARRAERRRRTVRWLLTALALFIVLFGIILFLQNSPYLSWDYSDPEKAVIGVSYHTLEWLFVRIAPIVLILTIAGIIATWRKER